MKRPHFLLVALPVVFLLASNQQAATRLVEKIEPMEGKIVIPYTKYVLANGLTLIVHEDHSDPLVHVDVTYHVGSGREEIGKSGFAHFFEHAVQIVHQGAVADNQSEDEKSQAPTDEGDTEQAHFIDLWILPFHDVTLPCLDAVEAHRIRTRRFWGKLNGLAQSRDPAGMLS